jgi:hypothetical protein
MAGWRVLLVLVEGGDGGEAGEQQQRLAEVQVLQQQQV